MSDKDMTGITKIEELFPGVKRELCFLHTKKAFRHKLSEYTCSPLVKEQIGLAAERMCEARSEEAYQEWKEKLSTLDENFHSYFEYVAHSLSLKCFNNFLIDREKWDSMRHCLVHFERTGDVNLGNTTNNRMESFHQTLKSELRKKEPLDRYIQKVLGVAESLQFACVHRQFLTIAKKMPTEHRIL